MTAQVSAYTPGKIGLPGLVRDVLLRRAGWEAKWEAYKATQALIARRRLPWVIVLCLAVLLFSQHFALAYVSTRSVDAHLVLVLKGVPPKRGDLVAFAYAGRPIGGHEKGDLFVKYLAGVPGDTIVRNGREFYLNGRSLGVAKERSGVSEPSWISKLAIRLQWADPVKSVPLEASTGGVIPRGMFWVHGTDRDALDSRYAAMGLTPRSSFVGKAVKIL